MAKLATEKNPNYTIISHIEPESIAAESYRKLKTNIEFASIGKEIKAIQINSASPTEGKTTTVLNLAYIYAMDGKKVCLVDLDLRKPKIHRSFRLKNEMGLNEYVKGSLPFNELIRKTDEGIDVIISGTKTPFPTVLLSSDKVRELFVTLKEMYDFIIVDCPPINAVTDALICTKYTDASLFVIAAPSGRKDEVKDALKLLRNTNTHILGAIYTGVSLKQFGYGQKYKYRYRDNDLYSE